MVVAVAGGYLQLLYSRNSPEMVARICRVAGRKTLQRCPRLHLAATCSRYLAGRYHDGGRIRHLRMFLVLVPPVLKCKRDAGEADAHEYDDEDSTCDVRRNIHYLLNLWRRNYFFLF